MSLISDTTTLHISLPQMLDLALATPEVGAININILHNFLHILLHVNNLKSTKVEYKGEDANRIQNMLSSSLKSGSNLQFHDYNIISEDKTIAQENIDSGGKDIKTDLCEDVNSVRNQSDTGEVIASGPASVRSAFSYGNISNPDSGDKIRTKIKVKINSNEVGKSKSAIFVEPPEDNIASMSSTPRKKEGSIKNLGLQSGSLNELSTTSGPIERTKCQCTNSVMDMQQAIDIRTRLNASEENINKLTTVEQDFMKNSKIDRQAGGGDIVEQVAHMNKRISEMEDNISSLDKDINNLQDQHAKIEERIDSCSNTNTSTVSDENCCDNIHQPEEIMSEPNVLGEVDCCKLRTDVMMVNTTITEMRDEICDLRARLYEMSKSHDDCEGDRNKNKNLKKCTISPGGDDNYVVVKQKQSDMKPAKCADLICDVEASLIKGIQCVERRLQCYEEFVNCSLRNIQCIISKNKSEEELIKYVQCVKIDLEELRKDVVELQYCKDQQDKQNDVFQEEIDVLKTVKADKECVEQALADKADICELNKKVSHEEFDAVCDNLARGLDEAMSKLNQLESIFQQSLAELRREMEGKLDELEIPAFKDFVNAELQAIKNQLRILSELKREQEAAGARKLLRNLRCISCDKDAFMRPDPKKAIGTGAFPCRATIRPYLTYKMDQVRKGQQLMSQGKNINNLEKIMNENMDCATRDQFVSRYCGGSHTIITPQQKVNKSKNYVIQSGIHDLQQVEGFVEGTDGQMYRGRWFLGQQSDKPNGVKPSQEVLQKKG